GAVQPAHVLHWTWSLMRFAQKQQKKVLPTTLSRRWRKGALMTGSGSWPAAAFRRSWCLDVLHVSRSSDDAVFIGVDHGAGNEFDVVKSYRNIADPNVVFS